MTGCYHTENKIRRKREMPSCTSCFHNEDITVILMLKCLEISLLDCKKTDNHTLPEKSSPCLMFLIIYPTNYIVDLLGLSFRCPAVSCSLVKSAVTVVMVSQSPECCHHSENSGVDTPTLHSPTDQRKD